MDESIRSLKLSNIIPLATSSGEWDETACLAAHENEDGLGESVDDVLHREKMAVNHVIQILLKRIELY